MEKAKKPMPRWAIVILSIAVYYILCITLPMAIIAIFFKSCERNNGEKEMIAYMDAIESECAEYSVADELDEEAKNATLFISDESIVVQNKKVSAEKMEDSKGYNIKIDETEIALDVDYFIANSETFNKIIKLWDDYEWDNKIGIFKVNVNNIEICPLIKFDDRLFVYIGYQPTQMGIDWKRGVPTCVFLFDVSDFSLQYIGYSKSYYEYPYIIKNK